MNRLKTLKTTPAQNALTASPDNLAAAQDSKSDIQHSAPTIHRPLPATLNLSSTNPKSQIPNPKSKGLHHEPCYAVNLGLMEYNQAWALQSELVAAKIDGRLGRDIILLVEHPSVFTLGRRGGRDYLQVGEAVLEQAGIPIVQAERGGYITFHGPGQAVVYPIIDLEARRLGVAEYVAALEEIMLQTVGSLGLQAQRSSTNPGIWMENRKMGSIGIALRKGIGFHGLALNVNLDLTPFSWIQPCGLAGVSMTSVQRELGREMPMRVVFQTLKKNFQSILGLGINDLSCSDLQPLLNRKMPEVSQFAGGRPQL